LIAFQLLSVRSVTSLQNQQESPLSFCIRGRIGGFQGTEYLGMKLADTGLNIWGKHIWDM